MDDIVLKSNKDMMGIDWKLAYMELQRITHMMKWDAKQRGNITFISLSILFRIVKISW